MPSLGLSIIHEPSLAERTSLGLGGRAIAELAVHDLQGFERLPKFLSELGGEPRILGRGTNILALDSINDAPADATTSQGLFSEAQKKLPIVLLKSEISRAVELLPEKLDWSGETRSLVRVGAACLLPLLLGRLAEWGLEGLEGLAGIPGNVGGAVAMNAGSYGCDIASCLYEVTIFTPSFGLRVLDSKNFSCAYRSFKPFGLQEIAGVPEWFMIIEATFALKVAPPETIRATMHENIQRKKNTQPIAARSAGCLFKNPSEGFSAGKLLDQAGFRGRSKGGMTFSDIHANFLLNVGGGTSDQAFELIAEAMEAVLRQHGVALEMEVKVWP